MRGSAPGTRGSTSVERDPPSASAASGTTPAWAVPGSVSASRVMSSLSPEPVLRSSASGLALPASVAGRDGTRLKYRPGLALRTNSRDARKCPSFLVCAGTMRLFGGACPGHRPCAPTTHLICRWPVRLDEPLKSRFPGALAPNTGVTVRLRRPFKPVYYAIPDDSTNPRWTPVRPPVRCALRPALNHGGGTPEAQNVRPPGYLRTDIEDGWTSE